MTYHKLLNYFEKVLKYIAPSKFGHPRMRFILILSEEMISSEWF